MIINILLGISSIIILLLVIGLFTRKEYSVEREIRISKPAAEVYDYIIHLKNQPYWSKWVMMDPNANMTYTGTDGTVGFVSAWNSEVKNVGKGSQTITHLESPRRLDLDLHFIRPFEGHAKSFMITESAGNGTVVRWGFSSSMKYPMNLMLLFMNMEKMLGNDMAEGLSNLKRVLEK